MQIVFILYELTIKCSTLQFYSKFHERNEILKFLKTLFLSEMLKSEPDMAFSSISISLFLNMFAGTCTRVISDTKHNMNIGPDSLLQNEYQQLLVYF